MAELDKVKTTSEAELLSSNSATPLIFISHDTRDAELADRRSRGKSQ